jgi:NADPH:quinone reductase-like Zn-dependent oxidoreductase
MFRSIVRSFGPAVDVVAGEEYLPPAPGPAQVRVRMSLASINPSDLVTISGAYASRTPLPFVPGFEGVGVIESVGADVTELSIGQRVLPLGNAGAWQDLKTTDARWCFPVPPELTDEQAATAYINPLTAVRMVHQHAPNGPAPVAVNAAASAIGQMIIRLLNDRGLEPIALVRNPDSRARLADLQLSAVVCTTEPRPHDGGLRATLREITGGQGLAVGWDAVGGAEGAELFRALSPGGTLVHYGLLSGRPLPPLLNPEPRDARIVLFRLRDWVHTAERSAVARALDDVYRLVLDGTAASAVAAVYPLPEVRQALQLHAAVHRRGKVLLRPN